jgi:carboxymethylenebutenolidase
MASDLIDVETMHGTMPVHVHHPATPGRHPVVLLYMDAPGIRQDLFEAAERLSAEGYTAVLPDLYYRLADQDRPNLELLRSRDEQEFARMRQTVAGIKDDDVLTDTRMLIDRLAEEGLTGAQEPWGCVGFCMGGRLGMRAAEEFGPALTAGALLHPSRLVTDEPDSPHQAAGQIAGELYLGMGENDHVTPLSTIPPLREELERHQVAHTIEVLPQAEHGYTMPSMPAYNREAAERAWAGTLALFHRRLPAARPS